MNLLTSEQGVHLYKKMIQATGGEFGIREYGLLDSALGNAMQTFEGNDLYGTIEGKCAVICNGLIRNHPFIDGNKRMGVYVMLVLLELNNIKIQYSQQELVELGLTIANGTIGLKDIEKWIIGHMVMEKG